MLSPPPSADEDAISTRQQWLQTHAHIQHTELAGRGGVRGVGWGHTQNMVLSVQESEGGGRGR